MLGDRSSGDANLFDNEEALLDDQPLLDDRYDQRVAVLAGLWSFCDETIYGDALYL